MWTDLRHAVRLMSRSPGFTAVAVLSLALGIGANTAIFSLIHVVMLRELAVERPGELVQLLQKYPGEPRGGYWSWRSYEHFQRHNHVFSGLTGTGFDNLMRVRTENGEPETVVGENVRANYFAFLGVKPALGRLIGPDDAPADGDGDVVVLSWWFWNSRFHGDPAVIGKRLYLQDVPKTIIGVAPLNYTGPRLGSRTDVWLPTEKTGAAILARLKPGVTIDQARAEMQVLHQFTIEERAASTKDPLVRQLKVEVDSARSGFSVVRDRYGKPLLLLMAAVGLLLLLACINIASLLLARGAGRQREMAVRAGLGATRVRLLRQMLTESVVLSGASTVAGCVLAYFATGALVRIMGSGRLHERVTLEVQPDWHVLLFSASIALLTGLLFGLAPALHTFGIAPASGLRQTGKAGETRSVRIFGKSLVAAQVGLSILLVTGACVLTDHVWRLGNQDLGFQKDHVLLVQLDPSRSGFRREQLGTPYQDLLRRLETIPGVRSASIAGCTPIQGCGASRFVTAEGYAERPEDRRFTALSWVAPKYFETLGIPLLAGRDFQFSDQGRGRVAIISKAMARHYFPGANPIGKHIKIDRNPQTGGWYGNDEPYEIVGVAGDTKYTELREPAPRTLYLNMFQEDRLQHQFILRTDGKPAALAGDVRETARDLLKTVTVTRVTTLADQVDAALVPERLMAALSGAFGAIAATLAGIGLYGLLAYTVARRVNEIGVRMALGATASQVAGMVLTEALALVAAGVAVGVPMVIGSRSLLTRLVEDLDPANAWPLVFSILGIVGIATLACWIPARRAAAVDPMEALRHD